LEISTDLDEVYPGTLLHFLRNCHDGRGCIILHNRKSETTFVGKGIALTQSVWSRFCEEIVKLEGESIPTPQGCGCWHIIRHGQLVAPFLLNRNPAHQYVPKTCLNARKVLELLMQATQEPVINPFLKPEKKATLKKRPKKTDVERALSHAAHKMLLATDKELLMKFVKNMDEADDDFKQWKNMYEKAQNVIKSW
jgi:hypothetical protein